MIENSIQNWAKFPVRAAIAAAGAIALMVAPAHAQDVESFDPDEVYAAADTSGATPQPGGIDADLMSPETQERTTTQSVGDWGSPVPVSSDQGGPTEVVTSTEPGFDGEFSEYSDYGTAQNSDIASAASADPAIPPASGDVVAADSTTYGEDDLIGAAEGVFGKGAEGLAGLIRDLLKEQGQPNGYIVGREAGGAFVVGARYGSGTLHHKVEGERKVYWTGPSIGFDVGANAANSFVLVYNLYDSEDLFERYPAGEGQAYLVGGLHVSYLRKGDVVLIPVRVGAGLRLGVNAGYMKFSKKQRWLPF